MANNRLYLKNTLNGSTLCIASSGSDKWNVREALTKNELQSFFDGIDYLACNPDGDLDIHDNEISCCIGGVQKSKIIIVTENQE